MAAEIRFLFDFISPYAYLASTQIADLARRHGRDVVAVPVLFARLLDANGTKGPAEIPAKRAYLYRDILRIGRALGVPIEPPASHPFNPLVALRMAAAVDDHASRLRLVDALYRAAWVESKPIADADTVVAVATEHGFDGPKLLERANSSEIKALLRENTETAVTRGVFGVPTHLVDDEMFWGVDSLPHLERFLAGERAAEAATLERWNRLAPSAMRRG